MVSSHYLQGPVCVDRVSAALTLETEHEQNTWQLLLMQKLK